jgi:hypothetical protein
MTARIDGTANKARPRDFEASVATLTRNPELRRLNLLNLDSTFSLLERREEISIFYRGPTTGPTMLITTHFRPV